MASANSSAPRNAERPAGCYDEAFLSERGLRMSDDNGSTVLSRAALVLGDPNVTTFTRAQMAFVVERLAALVAELPDLIDAAYRYGHADGHAEARAHFTELNLAAIRAGRDATPFSAAEIARAGMQFAARARADARPAGEYTGGPAPEWVTGDRAAELAEQETARSGPQWAR